jgi:hypothetical protein
MTTYSANQSNQVLDKVYDLFTDKSLSGNKEMGYDLYYSYSSESGQFTLSGTQRYGKPIQNPPVFAAINRIPTMSRNTNIGSMSEAVDGTDSMGTTRYVCHQVFQPEMQYTHLYLQTPFCYAKCGSIALIVVEGPRDLSRGGGSHQACPWLGSQLHFLSAAEKRYQGYETARWKCIGDRPRRTSFLYVELCSPRLSSPCVFTDLSESDSYLDGMVKKCQ